MSDLPSLKDAVYIALSALCDEADTLTGEVERLSKFQLAEMNALRENTRLRERIEKLDEEIARLHSIIDDAHHLSTLSLTAENRRLFALLQAAERVCEAVQATRLPWGATPIVSVREALAEWEAVKEDTHAE